MRAAELLGVAVAVLASGQALAGPVVQPLHAGVEVDWTAGVVRATRGVAARLSAPNPGLARTRAERRAFELAESAVRQAAAALAGDGGQGRASAAPVVRGATNFASDGSVRVSAELPVESLRVRSDRRIRSGAPLVVMVDARAIALTPALGRTVTFADATVTGPVVYFDSRKAADSDPRVRLMLSAGARLIKAAATAERDGTVRVAAEVGPREVGGAVLICLLVRP